MSQLFGQFLKQSKWMRDKYETEQREDIEDFDRFRVERRKLEWQEIEKREQAEKEIKEMEKKENLPRPNGKLLMSKIIENRPSNKTQPEDASAHVKGMSREHGQDITREEARQEEEYGWTQQITSDGTRIRKRLVHWWEFEYQLKMRKGEYEHFKEQRMREKKWVLPRGENHDPEYDLIAPVKEPDKVTKNSNELTKGSGDMIKESGANGIIAHGIIGKDQDQEEQRKDDASVVRREPLNNSTNNCDNLTGAQEPLNGGCDSIDVSRQSTLSFASMTTNTTAIPITIRPSWHKKGKRKNMDKGEPKMTEGVEHEMGNATKREVRSEDDLRVNKGKKGKVLTEDQEIAMGAIKNRLKDRLGEDGYFSYELLGECYVHGMMDGEAMRYQNEGDDEDQDIIPSMVFEIR
ncbi:hypothetical protein N0V90_011782 [Kalmusia sp. IMI 367209]|nr:hypothetical protein N0V90_011782 [Kalmusia sp. IMI 367209]